MKEYYFTFILRGNTTNIYELTRESDKTGRHLIEDLESQAVNTIGCKFHNIVITFIFAL